MPQSQKAQAASILVQRGRLTPEQADQRAPGWRLAAGGAPKLDPQERALLKDARTSAEKASSTIQDVERFSVLNRQQGSGGFVGFPGVRDFAGAFDKNVGEMNAINNRLTPMQREAGSGVMSDRDVEMYRSSTVGMGHPGPTNAKIGARMKAGAMRQRDHAAFLDYYARVNGSLNGAQERWDDYKEAEPIYDHEQGAVRTNARPWRDYFGVAGPSGLGGTKGAAATADKPAPGPIPTIRTPAEAAALPVGTKFRTPDGQVRVRR